MCNNVIKDGIESATNKVFILLILKFEFWWDQSNVFREVIRNMRQNHISVENNVQCVCENAIFFSFFSSNQLLSCRIFEIIIHSTVA